ncbi:hypothetical protein PTT_11166 [Pyrenophora teres f. teres 0-1]|uniref:Uncharacterized protein n=1 Tax=Pyrenophora teres f. teres (strain 0-1) TaxID=861557 RepID=E3RQX4_PYRTT|nr:hypothetical protein PTT_11166 [Pyrenophora teres f. teres 0-1]
MRGGAPVDIRRSTSGLAHPVAAFTSRPLSDSSAVLSIQSVVVGAQVMASRRGCQGWGKGATRFIVRDLDGLRQRRGHG